MGGRVHLFLAITPLAFGEAVIALRLARELDARGDRVVFLAPPGLGVLLRGSPVRFGAIDTPFWTNLDAALASVLREQRYASLILVDATQVYFGLRGLGRNERLPTDLAAPVLALDVWNLPETNLVWDTGANRWPIPDAAAGHRRLVPVPLVRPGAGPELYNALPPALPSRRAEARARAGLGERDRLVLVATASWQAVAAQVQPYHVHLARLVPTLIGAYLARLASAVRVVHVGPAPLPGHEALPHYRFSGPLPEAEFQDLVASADLLLSLNVAASTITAALRHDVPVVVVVNSHTVHGAEALADLGFAVRHAEVPPLLPFSVWPIGLHDFLAPVLRDNPYVEAIDLVELLEEEAFVDTCQALLFDPTARARAAERRAAYVARVERLPSGVDVLDAALR